MQPLSGSKLRTMEQACALVREGDLLATGGMTLYRRPMAFVRELARTRKRVELLGFTNSFDAELLAASDALTGIRSCYFGLEFFGLAPALRRAIERGDITIREETEFSISMGLQAALMHVPYLPTRDCLIGTDLLRVRPDFRRAPCPVTGETLTWFPAIRPRVAVIHVPLADAEGNAWLGGQHCMDVQLAMAADITILTAERIATTAEVRDASGGAAIVSFMVDAVVEAPGGAHPTSCFPAYELDTVHIARYLEQVRAKRAGDYLERYVHQPASLHDYLQRVMEDLDHEAA